MSANSISTQAETSPRVVRLADYTPPPFLIDTVDLTFSLSEAATEVVARLSVRRNPASPADAPLHLDGEALTLVGLTRDGVALTPEQYSLVPGGLVIPEMPALAVLEIATLIVPKENTELTGLYVSGGSYFTQCEAQGFRRITYFPDRSDVMSRYTTTIIADKAACPVMLSNGNPGASAMRERASLHHLDRSASQAVLSVRAGGRRSCRGEGQFRHPLRPDGRPWHLGPPRRRGSLRARDALAEDGDEMG